MNRFFLLTSVFIFIGGISFTNDLPHNERCITETESSPFSVSPLADGISIGVLSATTITALFMPKIIDMPEYDEFTYNLDDVNYLDRKFARKYSKSLDRIGDLTLALSYCLVPAVYGSEWLSDNFDTKEGIKLTVIYTETVLATQTAKCFLKTAIKRKRPYMYFDGYPEDELENYDFEFSLPSGHTSDTFMNAAFLSYTFCKYYPESDIKIPVVATIYSIAGITAGLRMASGNHFLTDTLAGAALGSAIGFGVPWLHALGSKISTDKAKITIMPSALTVSFKL